MTVDPGVIAKIQKLLDTRGRTPEEAAAYVAKAQDLMLAYDLSMESIADIKSDKRTSVTESAFQGLHDKGKPDGWKADLFEAVARSSDAYPLYGWTTTYKYGKWTGGETHEGGHFVNYESSTFCDYCNARRKVVSNSTRTAKLVGRPTDVEMAGYIYSYLVNEITRLTDEFGKAQWQVLWDEADRSGRTHQAVESEWWMHLSSHPLRAKLSFVRGAAEAVIESLQRDKEVRTRAAESNTALVVHKAADIDDYFDTKRADQRGMTLDEYRSALAAGREKSRRDAEARADVALAARQAETPAETARREKQERKQREQQERAGDKYWRAHSRRQAKAEAAIDWDAREAGVAAGRKVAVRPGIKSGSDSKTIGGD